MRNKEETTIIWNIDSYKLFISHPQKLYWPKAGYTKLDLLRYYKDIFPTLLPYLKDRPVTMHYFPRGIESFSFYKRDFEQKEENEKLFHTVPYKEISQDKIIHVPLIDSKAALLWMVSKGGIEFHLWSSIMPAYTHPDIVIFDLDINRDGDFNTVLQTAGYLNELLVTMDLHAYPKTSGGTGLHVYVPIITEYSFEFVRKWVKSIADKLANNYPKLITTLKDGHKTHQSNKVTIDYLQNVVSRNTAAPYTVRAYPGAPVSTPLTWDEVKKGGFLPKDFNIKNIPDRILKLGDLYSKVLTNKQRLPELF